MSPHNSPTAPTSHTSQLSPIASPNIARNPFCCSILALLFASMALPALAQPPAANPRPAAAAKSRGYTAGGVQLELDGRTISARRVSGGDVVGVVGSAAGDKRIASTVYEPIEIELSVTDAGPLLSDFLAGNSKPLAAALVYTGADGKILRRRTFADALLTRADFGPLDASSKDVATVTLTIQPSTAPKDAASDARSESAKSASGEKQKLALASNFRFSIPGVDCSRIAKVESFSISRAAPASGTGRSSNKPTEADCSNITLIFRGPSADLTNWHRAFVIDGKSSEEKTLRLEMLSQDMKTVLLTLDARGVGILAARESSTGDNRDAAPSVDAELYVEGWTLGG